MAESEGDPCISQLWNIINKKEPPDFDTTESKSRHGGK
nr:MAG TPA: hypothetical protein [Caudoviricetes sp.]